MNNELEEYIGRLSAAIYDNIDLLFPSFEFKGNRAKLLRSRLHVDGTPDKSTGGCTIKANSPTYVFNDGSEDGLRTIDFYALHHGLKVGAKGGELLDVLDAIADAVHIERLSRHISEESVRKYKLLDDVFGRAKTALFAPEGAATLDYLHGRGYSDEFIIKAGFGHLTKELAKMLNDGLSKKEKDGSVKYYAPKAEEFPLLIPLYDGSEVDGFKFRRITSGSDKYRNPSGVLYIHFHNVARTMNFVEGEIDAIHAEVSGLTNVAAVGGLSFSDEDVRRMKNSGIEFVRFVADADEKESTRKKVAERNFKNMAKLAAVGIDTSIAFLPLIDGKKVDVDSLLNRPDGKKIFEALDDYGFAEYAARYAVAIVRDCTIAEVDAIAPTSIAEDIDAKQKRKVAEIAAVSPSLYRESIVAHYSQLSNSDEIGVAELTEAVERMKKERDEEFAKKEIRKATESLNAAVSTGDIKRTAEITKQIAELTSSVGHDARFDDIRKKSSSLQYWTNEIRNTKGGIRTQYGIDKQRLILESGGLTYIAARTSHGKSRFLINIALDFANVNDGKLLYFVYEGNGSEVLTRLLSTAAGRYEYNIQATNPSFRMSVNVMKSIRSYIKEGKTDYFSGDSFRAYKEKAETFVFRLFKEERFAIIDEDLYLEDLLQFIREEFRNGKISAVFIDYIQKIKVRDGRFFNRKEELRFISGELLSLAKELGIPFVLAAQLNRQSETALEMNSSNIADCADIERDANTIVLLWDFTTKEKGYVDAELTDFDEIGGRPEDMKKDFIFAAFAKNRFGKTGGCSWLPIRRNSGAMPNNLKLGEAEDELNDEAATKVLIENLL